ncbi:hypothetical protein COU77_00600, partial [Candidatus Peregrinibacteria bacterium CG10_big_fil_rev_8_21_14_0_10_49_16]
MRSLCVLFLYLLAWPLQAVGASVSISELMWMGSDLSTADEWIELFSLEGAVLSGWKLTTLNGSGEEVDIVVFSEETYIGAGEYVLISNYSADTSRLADEPDVVTTQVLLPNTKLLVRLYDAGGNLVDEADDGVGVPFAGENGDMKKSMERIDLFGPGNMKEHWQTAVTSIGFDDGPEIVGTPGYARGTGQQQQSSSSSLSSSSTVSSMYSSSSAQSAVQTSSSSFVSLSSADQTSSVIFSSSSSSSATSVTSSSSAIQTSVSSPPSYISSLSSQSVKSVSSAAQSASSLAPRSSSSEVGCTPSTSQDIKIIRYIPNPGGKDSGNESITLKNTGSDIADLCGWQLDDAEGGSKPFPLDGVSIEAGREKSLLSDQTKIALNNTGDEVRLFDSYANLVHQEAFGKAAEGIEYLVMNSHMLSAEPLRVIDGDTIEVQFSLYGSTVKRSVRMIGIDAPELHKRSGENNPKGIEARDTALALMENKKIELYFDTEKYDVYGRLLAYVHADGQDVGRGLIERGVVEVYTKFEFSRMGEYLKINVVAEEQEIKKIEQKQQSSVETSRWDVSSSSSMTSKSSFLRTSASSGKSVIQTSSF